MSKRSNGHRTDPGPARRDATLTVMQVSPPSMISSLEPAASPTLLRRAADLELLGNAVSNAINAWLPATEILVGTLFLVGIACDAVDGRLSQASMVLLCIMGSRVSARGLGSFFRRLKWFSGP